MDTALFSSIHPDFADAHEAANRWTYPFACCKGDPEDGDCQRIPYAAVKTRPNGFVVTLYPGDHHRITTEEDVNCFSLLLKEFDF
ncbi:hypothetical protein NKJ40_27075 [Mesorhizobium sp. M0119]|uniref:hypothetical protein n=1 Tax=unclassified Mesorhizobium TaxID=325217 RepID=UPI003335F093